MSLLRIEPNLAPGGVVVRRYDSSGKLIGQRELLPGRGDSVIQAWAEADAIKDAPEVAEACAYDGDSGLLMGRWLAPKWKPAP